MARQADIEEANKAENKIDPKDKGMNWDRSCTDIFCCLLFVVFFVVMVGVSFLGFTQGDPMRIVTPFDSVGNRCGAKLQGVEIMAGTGVLSVNTTDYSMFPYKYFSNIQVGSTSTIGIFDAVCVLSCPKSGETATCMINSDVTTCPKATYDSTELGTYCMPEKDDLKSLFT
jgi:hypothetical protein